MAESEMEIVDLVAALRASIEAAKQRRLDATPCPRCGGDLLRQDFTDSGRCHTPRGDSNG